MEPMKRRSVPKVILIIVAGLAVFTFLFVIAVHITVDQLSRGIESSKGTGLVSVDFATTNMWSTPYLPPMMQKSTPSPEWVLRNANLHIQTSAFEQSAKSVSDIASAHQGFLENLVTESRSGAGRKLSAIVSVPSGQFYPTLNELKRIGRVRALAESGEDSAVKVENAERNVAAAEGTLRRLQALQRERKGQLHEALEVEKEIAQADAVVRQAVRDREALLSTTIRSHIEVMLLEDYRAPFQTNLADASLDLRNSFVSGASAIVGSLSAVVGGLMAYGLPTLFWCTLLFWPARMAWRRFRSPTTATAAAQ